MSPQETITKLGHPFVNRPLRDDFWFYLATETHRKK